MTGVRDPLDLGEAARETRSTVRTLVADRRFDDAWSLLRPMLWSVGEGWVWNAARNVLRAGARDGWSPQNRRSVRLGVLCTYMGEDLADHLEIACRALEVGVEIHAAPYGQLEQEVLVPGTALAAFGPTHVLLAPTAADLAVAEITDRPETLLGEQEERWRTLWAGLAALGARVLQHTFVVPDETPFGHLALRLPASRPSMVRRVNERIAAAAGSDVVLVDCERLAARLGKERWTDDRLWHTARQPFSFEGLRLLARETAAVLAGDVGLGARCLVVDLDNTLWGGLVAEEGAQEILVGEGPDGEAHAAFQSYLSGLAGRGILLAVASKNDAEIAREPFVANPRMRLGLDDFACFVADWRRKPEQVAEIGRRLSLPMESLVFVDDNPAECAEVAAALPVVDTIALTGSASSFVGRLAASPRFEISALTTEDAGRRRSYRALADAEQLREHGGSLEDFWRSLRMRAVVRDLLEHGSMDRAAQLTQKTNQFNLTLIRRSAEELRALAGVGRALCKTLQLEDRFADHGLIGLAFAVPTAEDPRTAVIDTLLLSCRVIGRTAEVHLLSHVSRAALEAGYEHLRGSYVAGPRNALVASLYPTLGFRPVADDPRVWQYDLVAHGPIESLWIEDAS